MSWEAIGAMGSLLGAISVLLTLLYLAKQIKENSKLLTTSVYHSAVDAEYEMASMFLENPELARNLLLDKPAQLSEPGLEFKLGVELAQRLFIRPTEFEIVRSLVERHITLHRRQFV